MTSDEAGLIAAIRDDLDDDAVRLVYADWLDEHDRADQAELIRVQIALACGKRRKGQTARAAQLMRQLTAELPAAFETAHVEWRRGMLVVAWYGGAGFVRCARELRATGILQRLAVAELTLTNSAGEEATLRAFVASGDLAALTSLMFQTRTPLATDALVALLDSPSAANLRLLHIRNDALGMAGAAALATSPHLANLRSLKVWSPLGAAGIERLVNSTTLAELRELVLLSNAASDDAMAELASATGLPKLRSLRLPNNEIGDGRLRRLLASPLLSRLGELVLSSNNVRDGGAKALAGCAALAGLKGLNLNGNQIGEAGARALLESPHLTSLEQIDVQWQPKIGEATLKALRKRFKKREAR